MDTPTIDPAPLSYLQKLPLLFSPFPVLSSSASHSLASRQLSLPSNELWTKCGTCRAEVVGGINGSYWIERGELWMRCQGCGWATKQLKETGMNEKGKGKEGFESVKKRRKIESRRVKGSNSHPTSFASHPIPVPSPLLKTRRVKMQGEKEAVQPVATQANDTTSISNSQTLDAPNPRPSSITLNDAVHSSRSNTAPPPAHASPSTSASPAPASPAPTSLDSKLAATKKRKRPKQPNGLAELLAKKKKDDGTGGSGGGGGLGLKDFLQGL